MSDSWLATVTVQLMLRTDLRLTQAAAVALRLHKRFAFVDPWEAVVRAFDEGLIRLDDLPTHYQTARPRRIDGSHTFERRHPD